jgi:hypothetical protein
MNIMKVYRGGRKGEVIPREVRCVQGTAIPERSPILVGDGGAGSGLQEGELTMDIDAERG